MSESLMTALQVSLVGMGLVFGSILALWLLMAVLVRVTAGRVDGGKSSRRQPPETAPDPQKAQAAAIAVAVALARTQAPPLSPFPLPPTAYVSAWQAVRRSSQLSQRGPVR